MEFMTHLFRFFIFFHRISRMNREAFLLIGLLTDFRGYLAAGQWLAPYICSCCFCHADFADGADFSLWGLFRPTDFTDIHRFFFVGIISSHRFHRYTQIFLCGDYFVPQISQIYTDFSLWRLFRPTDFTDIHRFFFVGLFPTSGGICTDRTGRLRENPCVIASSGKPPNKFRVIR